MCLASPSPSPPDLYADASARLRVCWPSMRQPWHCFVLLGISVRLSPRSYSLITMRSSLTRWSTRLRRRSPPCAVTSRVSSSSLLYIASGVASGLTPRYKYGGCQGHVRARPSSVALVDHCAPAPASLFIFRAPPDSHLPPLGRTAFIVRAMVSLPLVVRPAFAVCLPFTRCVYGTSCPVAPCCVCRWLPYLCRQQPWSPFLLLFPPARTGPLCGAGGMLVSDPRVYLGPFPLPRSHYSLSLFLFFIYSLRGV